MARTATRAFAVLLGLTGTLLAQVPAGRALCSFQRGDLNPPSLIMLDGDGARTDVGNLAMREVWSAKIDPLNSDLWLCGRPVPWGVERAIAKVRMSGAWVVQENLQYFDQVYDLTFDVNGSAIVSAFAGSQGRGLYRISRGSYLNYSRLAYYPPAPAVITALDRDPRSGDIYFLMGGQGVCRLTPPAYDNPVHIANVSTGMKRLAFSDLAPLGQVYISTLGSANTALPRPRTEPASSARSAGTRSGRPWKASSTTRRGSGSGRREGFPAPRPSSSRSSTARTPRSSRRPRRRSAASR